MIKEYVRAVKLMLKNKTGYTVLTDCGGLAVFEKKELATIFSQGYSKAGKDCMLIDWGAKQVISILIDDVEQIKTNKDGSNDNVYPLF